MSNEIYGIPRCGELWMCDLGDRGYGIQRGYRPVLVLSNDKNNAFAPTVNVAPLTTKMNKRNLPIHVELWDYERFGLRQPSTILIEQIMTVSINDLDRCIGRIDSEETINSIWYAISIQFPFMQMMANNKNSELTLCKSS